MIASMEAWQEFFKGKRITLMGLGLLGRGIGDARFLAEAGAKLLVTDLKSKEELQPALDKLAGFPSITYRLGSHKEEDFVDTDMVLYAAGVPLSSHHLKIAREAGVPVYMSTALAAKFARGKGVTLVGVTGTRGKSTVSGAIYHTLKEAGRTAHLGGNVRDRSTLEMVPELKEGDVLVLELDSWQLQGFGALKLSPEVAVFTNLMPDHLNYYKDAEEYFNDKAQIFSNQREGDHLIVGRDIAQKIAVSDPPVAPVIPKSIPSSWRIKLIGEHNRENASLAAEALRNLGLSEEEIKAGLESFEGMEGRLQLVKEVQGIKIYNDNNATTPQATIAALKALLSESMILITGGADKNLPLEDLALELEKCKKVVLLSGSGSEKLKKLIQNYTPASSMEKAVEKALAAAEPGDTILFSPSFASFGMFKNEYDRNDQFMKEVKSLH